MDTTETCIEVREFVDGKIMIFEDRIQRYSEKTGQPIEPIPYRILTAVIDGEE